MTTYLFAYGTLLPAARSAMGAAERNRLGTEATYLGPAFTQGALVDLGGYPGLIAGTGMVHGGVYRLHAADPTWAWLDIYEGLGGTDGVDYDRREIAVSTLDNSALTAWAYFWIGSQDLPLIPSGRWPGTPI